MSDLLRVENLSVEFGVHGGVVRAVKGASFRVGHASTVALVGESGSGKSVISQAIMGILPQAGRVTGGAILFDDPDAGGHITNLATLNTEGQAFRRIRGGRISIIFQEPMTSLSPLHTVGNQVTEAVKLHRDVTDRAAEDLAREMLGLVGFPDPAKALRTYPFELSGGLRQRAMIAMALVCRPALLVADEPTTALDVTIQAQILKLIRDLQQELRMSVLMITHDLGVVANVADEVVVLYQGEVMESGTLEALFDDPRHPYLQALLRAVPRFDMKEGERLMPIREIRGATGHLLAEDSASRGPDRPGSVVDVSGVSKTFAIKKSGLWGDTAEGRNRALDDVSFSIRRGECLGLVGESGCGKTTLSKVLMRAVRPDAGMVKFIERDGTVIDVLSLHDAALKKLRRKMQFIFQDPYSSLNPRMTVFDIVTEPLVIHGIGDKTYRTEMAKELMSLVGLDLRHLRRYPHSFSGGQRQRIGIARALALRPELLICDEPVSALDVSIQAQILNLLKDLRRTLGLTYLFISHNLAVVDYIADRIMVMCQGAVVELAPRDRLFRNPVHPYTKALLAAVPHPDPSQPLDLAVLRDGRASDPAAWPQPFTLTGDARPEMIDLGGGHYVRALPQARTMELAS